MKEIENERENTTEEAQNVHLKRKIKRWQVVLCAVLVFVVGALGVLQIGVVYTEKTWTHWYPDYEKTDILPILEKQTLADEDYITLYAQTGLTKFAIDDMRDENGIAQVLRIQDFLFKEHKVDIVHFNPFTYTEEIDGFAEFAYLRDGDIIVTATTRVSWWRYGHAALVVNGKDGLVIESIAPGAKSEINSVEDFSYLANFLILRPKASDEVKTQVVEYAKNELLGIPYRLTVGVFSKKYNPKELKYSQCAHLVWYAYKKFGFDLDSNGGAIVKPQDMALSEHVEVVQAFGFEFDKLWS